MAGAGGRVSEFPTIRAWFSQVDPAATPAEQLRSGDQSAHDRVLPRLTISTSSEPEGGMGANRAQRGRQRSQSLE